MQENILIFFKEKAVKVRIFLEVRLCLSRTFIEILCRIYEKKLDTPCKGKKYPHDLQEAPR